MGAVVGIQFDTPGLTTLYAVVRNTAGQVVRQTDGGLETYLTANLANYDFPLAEDGVASRYYRFTFPAVPADQYSVLIFNRVGAAPAETDDFVSGGPIHWDGSKILGLHGARLDPGAIGDASFSPPAEGGGLPAGVLGKLLWLFARAGGRRVVHDRAAKSIKTYTGAGAVWTTQTYTSTTGADDLGGGA